MKKVAYSILYAFLALLLIVIGYLCYILIDYKRVDDNIQLEVASVNSEILSTNSEYTSITYNIGFGAYTQDFGFFLDGGSESRAKSKESVIENINDIINLVKEEDCDIILFQEVDTDSTRSYHVNESEMIKTSFENYDSSFAINYDSSYLFYPLLSPHGKSKSGMLTLSKYKIESSLRRKLPVETGFNKFFDLDRCYNVSRLKVDNGKELVLYTIHLSAYSEDENVRLGQIRMLVDDMKKEYEAGNYVICGGDFNKDLLGDSSKYFKIDGSEYSWAKPFPMEELPNSFKMVNSIDYDNLVPSCRNADGPYNDKQLVLVVDGFIVSNNVEVINSNIIDNEFLYSDHNPVKMTFKLID